MRRYRYINELIKDRIRLRKRLIHDYANIDNTLRIIHGELEGRDKLSMQLIKLGAIIFVIPILGISEIIGILVMGIGGLIGLFRKKYPITRVGRDLRNQIESLHEYRKEFT